MKSIPIEKLKPWKKNPRTATKEDVGRLKRQIQRLGKYKPLLVTGDHTVIGGNMRLRVLEEMGEEDVECSVIEFKDVKAGVQAVINGKPVEDEDGPVVHPNKESAMLEYALSDNDQIGTYDFQELAELSMDQDLPSGLYRASGGRGQSLEDVLEQFAPTDEDEPPEPDREDVKSKPGQTYKLGEHRVHCGDATKPESYPFKKQARLCFTSPPYNMKGGLYKHYADDLDSNEFINLNMKAGKLVMEHLDGFLFWNLSYNLNARWEHIEVIHRFMKELGLQFLEHVVWDKGHAIPVVSDQGLTRQFESVYAFGDEDPEKEEPREVEHFLLGRNGKGFFFNKRTKKAISNYWRIDTAGSQSEDNNACFPVALPAHAIKLMTEEGDVVLDPFLGSGTTLIACEQLNRVCYGIELQPAYVDVIRKRYAEYVGEEQWEAATPAV